MAERERERFEMFNIKVVNTHRLQSSLSEDQQDEKLDHVSTSWSGGGGTSSEQGDFLFLQTGGG